MMFRSNLESELDKLFMQVKMQDELIVSIMDILPEGIIILDRNDEMAV
jgi:hypothetical protein